MKNILITGGLGLIGHNVALRLYNQGHRVVIVDTKTDYGMIPSDELNYLMKERKNKIPDIAVFEFDITDVAKMQWLFNVHHFDAVIHLASFPRQKVVNANPAAGSRVMSEGLLTLLEIASAAKVDRFFYASSSMVYGEFKDQTKEDAPLNPEGQYGIMKLAGEWLVRDYTRKTGLKHTIFRPSAVYGPLDVEDRVISKFILTALRGGVLKVNGKTETLDFTYVDDAADGIVAATLSENTINKTYNITKSHSKTLFEAALLAVELARSGQVEIREKDADFPSRGALNIDAARRDFGFDPKVDIEEGFEKYYEWFKTSKFWQNKLKG